MLKIYDKSNIFNKIINGVIPCDKVHEDDYVLAIHDINPVSTIHILVMPKGKHISFDDFVEESADVVLHFFQTVKKIASDYQLNESGYKLVTNHGEGGGQIIPHFHVHIIGN